MSMIKAWLKHYNQYKSEYDGNMALLYQVGTFFEVYALVDKKGNYIKSNIEEYAKVCNLAIAKKSKVKIDGHSVVMAGFHMNQLHVKYLDTLINNNYTVIIYTQDVQGKNTSRSLHKIYSPGTYFSSKNEVLSNNIACIWIESYIPFNDVKITKLQIGMSLLNINTGNVLYYQYENENNHTPSVYDDLERFLCINNPKEIIFVSKLDNDTIHDIIKYTNLNCDSIHILNLNDDNGNDNSSSCILLSADNCEKQVYQKAIFQKFYPNSDIDLLLYNLSNHTIATQSLCYLLEYVNRHDSLLVKEISEPVFENNSDNLLLANHSLKQLNIINNQQYRGKLSSVLSLLNNCLTNMGKRKFKERLLHPTTIPEDMERSYKLIEHTINKKYYDFFKENLSHISDIEKFNRNYFHNKVSPSDFSNFHNVLSYIEKIFNKIKKDKEILNNMFEKPINNISKYCKKIKSFISSKMNIKIASNINSFSFEKYINNDGDYNIHNLFNIEEYDYLKQSIEQYDLYNNQLNNLCTEFNNLLSKYEKKNNNNNYFKIDFSNTHGVKIIATARRCDILLNILKKNNNDTNLENFNNLQILKYSGSNKMLINSKLQLIYNNITLSKNKLLNNIEKAYNEFLSNFKSFYGILNEINHFITHIDVLYCNVHNAQKYNYTKPTITKKNDSFVDVKGLRHCLIEHLQKDEIYVTNDLDLGFKTQYGFLLYGTNAVGKTSLIRALGICVILAQAGMYVPCSYFNFNPYKYLFTRIIGNDNLFRGLSTYAVEISELKTIVKLCDNNSLILGDEICSGTESYSALSIIVATLEQMNAQNSSYIFATHYHELKNYSEIQNLETLSLKHMSITCDPYTKKIIYNRKLKNGPGKTMYGLEVCKSLGLPDKFIKRAENIRIKYNPELDSILNMDKSPYNSKKIKGNCEICKKNIGDDVHHLQYKQYANDNNYIVTDDNSFHKNHPANLANVCKKCHDEIHSENKQMKKMKTSDGYEFVNVSGL